MARVQTVQVPAEIQHLYRKSVQQSDRFFTGSVRMQQPPLSRTRRKELTRASIVHSPQEGRGTLFKYLAPMWRTLTTDQKNVWKAAGAVSGLSNWQLFISDNAQRIRNSLTLMVPPQITWQVRTGYITLSGLATEIILKQEHPQSYWVTKKKVGQPWKQELNYLLETFSFPLTLGIRYKSNLTAVGGEQRARYYARVHTKYQGNDVFTDLEIPFSANTDWVYETVTLDGIRGIFVGYTLFLELVGYQGTFFLIILEQCTVVQIGHAIHDATMFQNNLQKHLRWYLLFGFPFRCPLALLFLQCFHLHYNYIYDTSILGRIAKVNGRPVYYY